MTPDFFLNSLQMTEDEKNLVVLLAQNPMRYSDMDELKELDEARQKELHNHAAQYTILLNEQNEAAAASPAAVGNFMDDFGSTTGSFASSKGSDAPIDHNLVVNEAKKQLAAAKAQEMKTSPSLALRALAEQAKRSMLTPPAKAMDKTSTSLLPSVSETKATTVSTNSARLFGSKIPASVSTFKTSWTTETITSAMTDISEITADLRDFEYEGLDVLHCVEKLAGIAEANGRTIAQFRQDMEIMVGIVVMRGINYDKILSRTNRAGARKLKMLFDLYEVEKNEEKKPVGKDKVILSRFTACFPIVAANMLARGLVRPLHMEGDLPIYLRFMGGAALIPSTEEKLFNDYKSFAQQFDIIVNGVEKADATKVEKFANIAWKSNLHNDAQRVKFCEEFNKM